MNETHEPFEAELGALRPHEPSTELRQRIGDRLAPSLSGRTRRLCSMAIAGGLIAACVVVAIVTRRESTRVIEVDPRIGPPQAVHAVAFDDSLPTVSAYSRALARSSEELDALMDHHARTWPALGEPLTIDRGS